MLLVSACHFLSRVCFSLFHHKLLLTHSTASCSATSALGANGICTSTSVLSICLAYVTVLVLALHPCMSRLRRLHLSPTITFIILFLPAFHRPSLSTAASAAFGRPSAQSQPLSALQAYPRSKVHRNTNVLTRRVSRIAARTLAAREGHPWRGNGRACRS